MNILLFYLIIKLIKGCLFFMYTEHEACAIDINELRWHCAYRGRVEVRISEKVRQAGKNHLIIVCFFIDAFLSVEQ